MTCGIYKLMFKGTDSVYIGQSTNIEKRYTDHKSRIPRGIGNAKLTEAYKLTGEPPTLVVLEECSEDKLDYWENYYIELHSAITNGLNSGNNVRTGCNLNIKYSKQQLILALNALIDPSVRIEDVSSSSEVSVRTLEAIIYRTRHPWVDQEHPGLIDKILLVNKIRKAQRVSESFNTHSPNARSSVVFPSKVVKVVNPLGVPIELSTTMKQFCIDNNLNASSMSRVVCGTQKDHKGWTKYAS